MDSLVIYFNGKWSNAVFFFFSFGKIGKSLKRAVQDWRRTAGGETTVQPWSWIGSRPDREKET